MKTTARAPRGQHRDAGTSIRGSEAPSSSRAPRALRAIAGAGVVAALLAAPAGAQTGFVVPVPDPVARPSLPTPMTIPTTGSLNPPTTGTASSVSIGIGHGRPIVNTTGRFPTITNGWRFSWGHHYGFGWPWYWGQYPGDFYFSDPSAGTPYLVRRTDLSSGRSSEAYWFSGYRWHPATRISQQPSVYIPAGFMADAPMIQEGDVTAPEPVRALPPIERAREAMRNAEFAVAVDAYREHLTPEPDEDALGTGATDGTDGTGGTEGEQPGASESEPGMSRAAGVDPLAVDPWTVWRELSVALAADGRVTDAVSVLGYAMDTSPGVFRDPVDGRELGFTAGDLGRLSQRAARLGQESARSGALLLAVELERATPRPRGSRIRRLLDQAAAFGSGWTPIHEAMKPEAATPEG